MSDQYKKFLLVSLLLCIPMLLAYLIIDFYFSDSVRIFAIKSMYDQKKKYASSAPGNKIIFNSGSTTLFGINTKTLSDEINFPVYNLAINAGLGLKFIIDQTKEIARNGDTVILPLEYNHYQINDPDQKHAFNFYRTYNKEKLKEFKLIHQVRFLLSDTPLEILSDTLEAKSARSGLYKYVSHLDDHGDYIGNTGIKLKNYDEIEFPKNFKETYGLKLLKEFNVWCKDNHISLYVTYPNTVYFKDYDDKNHREYFNNLQNYFNENNIKTIGSPQEAFYDADYFYDSNYHLNAKGVAIRTEQVKKQLQNNVSELKSIAFEK
jgi:hypothetical protein